MDTEAFLNSLGIRGPLKRGILIAVPAVLLGVFVTRWLDDGALNQKDATIGQKDATIQGLDEQIKGYKDKLNGATPEEAQRKIVNLETRLARLEPRQITDDQRKQIFDVLSQAPDSQALVSSDMSCSDCGAFSAGFIDVLTRAGRLRLRAFLGPPTHRLKELS